MQYLLGFLTLLLTISCKPRNTSYHVTTQTETDSSSREILLAGEVEKKWVIDNSAGRAEKDELEVSRDIRYIFYRNYNVTTFGEKGSRQGHWSFDNDNILSFHFDGADSLARFEILELDTNVLILLDERKMTSRYKPE